MTILVYIEDTFIFSKFRADNSEQYKVAKVPIEQYVSVMGFHFPRSESFQPALALLVDEYPEDKMISTLYSQDTVLRPDGSVHHFNKFFDGQTGRINLPVGENISWVGNSLSNGNLQLSIKSVALELYTTAKDVFEFLKEELLMPEGSLMMYTRDELLQLIKDNSRC